MFVFVLTLILAGVLAWQSGVCASASASAYDQVKTRLNASPIIRRAIVMFSCLYSFSSDLSGNSLNLAPGCFKNFPNLKDL